MRRLAIVAVLLFVSAFAYAQAKPCEELKGEIAKKLEEKGVKSYTLDVVEKDKEVDGKVVGTCEGGTKKIVYRRESTPPPTQEKPAKKP